MYSDYSKSSLDVTKAGNNNISFLFIDIPIISHLLTFEDLIQARLMWIRQSD